MDILDQNEINSLLNNSSSKKFAEIELKKDNLRRSLFDQIFTKEDHTIQTLLKLFPLNVLASALSHESAENFGYIKKNLSNTKQQDLVYELSLCKDCSIAEAEDSKKKLELIIQEQDRLGNVIY